MPGAAQAERPSQPDLGDELLVRLLIAALRRRMQELRASQPDSGDPVDREASP